jgi:hypothetical protein
MVPSDQPQRPPFQNREEAIDYLRQSVEDYYRDQAAWLHWEYSPEEWLRFDALDWRPRRRVLAGLLFGLVIALPTTITAFLVGYAVLGLLGAVGILAVVTAVNFWLSELVGWDKRRHQARKAPQAPHRVTFGKQGLWVAGIFCTFDHGLKQVRMTARPPALYFRAFITTTNPQHTSTTTGMDRMRILVPRGCEEEAARLVERYQSEVIDAERRSLEAFRNPPEPR